MYTHTHTQNKFKGLKNGIFVTCKIFRKHEILMEFFLFGEIKEFGILAKFQNSLQI